MKTLSQLLTALMVMLTVSACKNEDIIYDYAPYVLNINITDKEGNNLLDPDVDGNITDETIEMEYDGQTYTMVNTDDKYHGESIPVSRYYLPHFYGLSLNSYRAPWHLSFGEFDRAVSAEYEMTLRIPARNIEKHFKVTISRKKDDRVADMWVDGVKHKPADEYTIVL